MSSPAAATLADALWPTDTVSRRLIRAVVLLGAGLAVLTISAQVRVPFYPVPFTMQSFAVLVIGLTYGARLAAITVGSYLAAGAGGMAVFAGWKSGVGILSGPTAGYLWGFLVAAAVLGVLAEKGWTRDVGHVLAACWLGVIVIFAGGLLWLAQLVGVDAALSTGLAPFVLSETIKVALAVATVPLAWRLVEGQSTRM